MKLVFLDDVPGVAHGGDVKNVKNGFATQRSIFHLRFVLDF